MEPAGGSGGRVAVRLGRGRRVRRSGRRLLADASPPTRQAEAAVSAALLRLKSSRGFDAAIGLLETALRRYVAAGDRRAGLVHSRLGGALSLHHSVMNIPRALDHFDAAERLLPSPETVFHLHRGRCQAAMYGLRTDLLLESADRAAAIAEGPGDATSPSSPAGRRGGRRSTRAGSATPPPSGSRSGPSPTSWLIPIWAGSRSIRRRWSATPTCWTRRMRGRGAGAAWLSRSSPRSATRTMPSSISSVSASRSWASSRLPVMPRTPCPATPSPAGC